MATDPPDRLGGYEIVHALRTGGMGEVLLGRRRGPGAFEQLVAIKTIRAELARAEAVRAMFLDEAAILARVAHPAVAAVHDFGEHAGALYLAMAYVAGVSFRALAELAPPPAIAARAIAEACRGLHAAHEARDADGHPLGIVHRDISPDNLMLGFDGRVVVIDFGIALVRNRQAPVTELGTLKGKPPYMSPEQLKNLAVDRRSDVFSLAVVLHELLARAPLFTGESIYAVAHAVEHQPIAPPSLRAGPLPAGLDAAVLAALARPVAERTPSAAALAEQLEQVAQDAGGESLAAWATRALAPARAEHQRWLAAALGHQPVAPRGRPSDQLTAVASPAPAEPAPIATPRRRWWLPAALFSLLLAGSLWVRSSRRDPAPPVEPAPVVVAATDAAVPDAPPPDALAPDAPPPDAAPRRRRTAPPPPPPPPTAPATAGRGKLTIPVRNNQWYRLVIDGVPTTDTPYLHQPIAAGPHVIEFRDPATNAVVDTRRVVVPDGVDLAIEPPRPRP